ncbi:MAG: M4 family metallopeptidase [Myxococcota bacterium]
MQTRAFATDPTDSVLFMGALGCVSIHNVADESVRFVDELSIILGGDGTESYDIRFMETDRFDLTTVRVRQHINDLPVAGSEMVMQVRASTGEVVGISGEFIPAGKLPKAAKIKGDVALTSALAEAGIAGERHGQPELTYVRDPAGQGRLAWVQDVSYRSERGPELDRVFADAATGELVTRHPRYHHILDREIYDAQNTQTQGVLVMSEGQSSNNPVAQAAYDFVGDTYNYYATKFDRNSFDGLGATVVSVVHFDQNLSSAFWTGAPNNMMVYGDGDGQRFGPLAQSRDVVAHEMTHAVIENTAGLIYQGESGALNEAMSDIFGVAVGSHSHGGVVDANTWLLAEDVFTPGIPGDSLRYMDNPTRDGISTDYYPTRYIGDLDYGGVHWNSGIANLAFYLLVSGGTHPRGMTNISVPAIGIEKAEQIFYRALSTYMTPSTNFAGARMATSRAARDLYGFGEYSALHRAWSAVGVPGSYTNFTANTEGGSRLNGSVPFTVNFIDTSAGATSWSWNFGDGTTSTEQNPTHVFEQPGTYKVSLSINGDPNTKTPDMSISVTDPIVPELPVSCSVSPERGGSTALLLMLLGLVLGVRRRCQ